ncbi:FAD-dependent oxidoreductase [Humidisolicoccus flavus]|uniref:FAD-dependent oxidoreductase n=1 Tax=Humidisolicoccus flavus TaxID=3111414 RepID=UPI003248564B
MDTDVIIIGAGPVGLTLSTALTGLGVDCVVLESEETPGAGSKAIGIHPPSLEALERFGVTERILGDAVRIRRGEARVGDTVLGSIDFARPELRFPFVAALPQHRTEAALRTLAGPVLYGHRAVRVIDTGARAPLRHGPPRCRVMIAAEHGEHELNAQLVVVAGGTRARDLLFRRTLHTTSYPDRYLMADVPHKQLGGDMTSVDAPDWSDCAVLYLDQSGILESFPLPSGRRLVAWDHAERRPKAAHDSEAARERLTSIVRERGGSAHASVTPEQASGFGIRKGIAPWLQRGSVVLIGDTAHEVSPIGGQGMNLGLLDAASLAPVLARWIARPEERSELQRWERSRLRSAHTAARIADVNTKLGRPTGEVSARLKHTLIRTALRGGAARLLARTYSMGFDSSAP